MGSPRDTLSETTPSVTEREQSEISNANLSPESQGVNAEMDQDMQALLLEEKTAGPPPYAQSGLLLLANTGPLLLAS